MKRLDEGVVLIAKLSADYCVDRQCFIAMSLNEDQRRLYRRSSLIKARASTLKKTRSGWSQPERVF
jgi:hypothetical protein